MRRDSRRWVLLSLIAAAGCSTYPYQDLTTATVECEPSPPEISKLHRGRGGPAWWTATCGETVYFCSVLHQRAICSEVPEDATQPTMTDPPGMQPSADAS